MFFVKVSRCFRSWMMERYHDFSMDACLVDGVSIAESLLYKDSEKSRGSEIADSGCMKAAANNPKPAPTNAVAAAAFGSVHTRGSAGALEERKLTRGADCQQLSAGAGDGLSTQCSAACDHNYNTWNELVNKLVDSQEDIPSLLLDSGNAVTHATSTSSSAAPVTSFMTGVSDCKTASPLSVTRLKDFGSCSSSSSGFGDVSSGLDLHSSCKHTDSPNPSTSSSSFGIFQDCVSENAWLPRSGDYGCYRNYGNGDNDVMTSATADSLSSTALTWSSGQFLFNNLESSKPSYDDLSTSLHHYHSDPLMPSEGSNNVKYSTRLRPITGKTEEPASVAQKAASLSILSTSSQADVSHLLPLFRGGCSELMGDLGNTSSNSSSANTTSASATVGSTSTNVSCSSPSASVFNCNTSISGNMYQLSSDSLRLASRSQLNPNAEKFVYMPSSSMNTAMAQHQHQQQQLQQQHHQQAQQSPVFSFAHHHHHPHHFHHSHNIQQQQQQQQQIQKTHGQQAQSPHSHSACQQQQHQMQQQFHHQQAQQQKQLQHHQQQQHTTAASFLTVQPQNPYVPTVSLSQTSATMSSSSCTSNSSNNSGSNSNANSNGAGTNNSGGSITSNSCSASSLSSTHHLLPMNTLSPVSLDFQSKFNTLTDQRKSLDRERNRIEAELCRQYPGKRITSGVCGSNLAPTVKTCNSADKVDKELNTVLGNHARVVSLIAKMEKLQNGEPLPSHVHSTMECWLEGIRKCQARRKEELVNMTNRQRSGPRQQDEKDVIALTLALAELTEHMRRSRTVLWAALQMTHKDRAPSAREAFRFLDHVRRYGLTAVMPPPGALAPNGPPVAPVVVSSSLNVSTPAQLPNITSLAPNAQGLLRLS